MCDIITPDGTPQLSSFLIVQLFFCLWLLVLWWCHSSLQNPGTFYHNSFLAHLCRVWLRQGLAVCSWCSFCNDIIAKCDRSVHLKHFLYVSRKVFALLPFACGCPVWLYPVKCSRDIQLQMLSNPSFPVAWVERHSYCGSSWLYSSCHVKLVIILFEEQEGRTYLESIWTWWSHAVTIDSLMAVW